jgi:hypothetical protein
MEDYQADTRHGTQSARPRNDAGIGVENQRRSAFRAGDRKDRFHRVVARSKRSRSQSGTNLRTRLGKGYRTTTSKGVTARIEERHGPNDSRQQPLNNMRVTVEEFIAGFRARTIRRELRGFPTYRN